MLCIVCFIASAMDRQLALPAVPSGLRQPQERAEYILNHFWDGMDWGDTAAVADRRFMEQASADFYSLFQFVDSAGVSHAAGIMLDGASASPAAYRTVADIARLYLYDTSSPMTDEEAYLAIADRLLADGLLPPADLLRVEDAHDQAMLNRVGHRVNDFQFAGSDGVSRRLSDVLKDKPRTMLLFYDPDCRDCAEFEHRLARVLPDDAGVVMICPYEVEDGVWLRHASMMPHGWIVGRPVSDDFEGEGLYSIRSTPTALLVDSAGVVLKKNIKESELEALF